MAKRQKVTPPAAAADSDELQALFDSIASQAVAPTPAPEAPEPVVEAVAAPANDDVADDGDNDELQALFDSVSALGVVAAAIERGEVAEAPAAVPAQPQTAEERQEHVFNRIGQMTRVLHDTIRELGYDRMLEETAQRLPDARERLSYISQMTEQAASRVLNATDIVKPIQDRVEETASELNDRWEQLYDKKLSVDEFKSLAGQTRTFLGQVANDSRVVNEQLLEIMMAQDFQDLTGQVIKKIVDMAQTLESELLRVLIEVMPENRRHVGNEGLLNGPVVNAEGRDDVVTDQGQVDDLLESLGF
ncbi:protein phosphatase CheZ [Uliginosibacterium sp. sgz301328]|uniref:protein phosphatase CheZ n=1 Tax=Uliginosibacterium sp. sgz301328 TaxID=3243764 RepID=UPI00359E43A3